MAPGARLPQPRSSRERPARIQRLEPAPDPATLRLLAAVRPDLFPALFDTVTPGPMHRHTILAAFPKATLRLMGDGRLLRDGSGWPPAGAHGGNGFLDSLDAWWRDERSTLPAGAAAPVASLPFRGGWVVYLGYELAAEIEPTLRLPALPAQAVCAAAIRVRAAIVLDHLESRAWFVSEGDAAEAAAGLRAVKQAIAALERRGGAGATSAPAPAPAPASAVPTVPPRLAEPGSPPDADELAFRDAVLEVQQRIAAGDIYQANLSRPWRLPTAAGADPAELYSRLCAANPAPFAALAQLGGHWLLSSSPERLVRVRGDTVETRPIAGTRRRQGGAGDDLEQRELLANPKERAEHVMLIDLERNDLGRVCEAGSVLVDEFMVTESYPHLHHIVSNVRGRLRPGTTPGAVLRAVFPGGTITGCPKHRCMQIIGELEREPRGAYTGSLGYLNLDGDMDFNILIRTAVLDGSTLQFRTGAGIVADSDWLREIEETRTKARGMLRAFAPAQAPAPGAEATT
jgi:anthranilate synthase component 1